TSSRPAPPSTPRSAADGPTRPQVGDGGRRTCRSPVRPARIPLCPVRGKSSTRHGPRAVRPGRTRLPSLKCPRHIRLRGDGAPRFPLLPHVHAPVPYGPTPFPEGLRAQKPTEDNAYREAFQIPNRTRPVHRPAPGRGHPGDRRRRPPGPPGARRTGRRRGTVPAGTARQGRTRDGRADVARRPPRPQRPAHLARRHAPPHRRG